MTSFYGTLIALMAVVLTLLWWFSRRADQHKQQAITQLTETLRQPDLSAEKRHKLQQKLAEAMLNAGHSDTRAWWVPAVVIIAGGFYLYHLTGMPEATDRFVYSANQNTRPQTRSANAVPDMQTALAALKKRIAANPENLDNWLLYGRSMMAMKDYTEAVRAYEQARQLQPDNAWVLASLAEAKAFAAGTGTFRGEPEKLLQRALELDPDNQKALWLMGMNAYEQGQPAVAEKLWTRLLALIDNPRVAEQLRKQINLVRQQQGKSALADTDSTPVKNGNTTAAGAPAAIPVRVDISPEMRAQLSNKPAVLYIYAKPAGGMPMPIAVVRSKASDLPLVVTLSDENSLQAARPLSGFDKVIIGARISFSGNAMPQAGDIEADEKTVTTQGYKQAITLLLNKIR